MLLLLKQVHECVCVLLSFLVAAYCTLYLCLSICWSVCVRVFINSIMSCRNKSFTNAFYSPCSCVPFLAVVLCFQLYNFYLHNFYVISSFFERWFYFRLMLFLWLLLFYYYNIRLYPLGLCPLRRNTKRGLIFRYKTNKKLKIIIKNR